MHVHHPSFRSPEDINGKIWQYLGLEEFVSVLFRKALFFVKASKLRDPYEGMVPKYNNLSRYSMRQQGQREFPSKNQHNDLTGSLPETMAKGFQTYRDLVMINSWHYSKYESAAMWQL